MSKLGTYSTIDCPTDRIDEAFEFLSEKFRAINGSVRQVYNSHDFGPYPSFEIDYPIDLEDIDTNPFLGVDEELDEDELELIDEKEKWIDEANKIEREYSEKFSAWL